MAVVDAGGEGDESGGVGSPSCAAWRWPACRRLSSATTLLLLLLLLLLLSRWLLPSSAAADSLPSDFRSSVASSSLLRRRSPFASLASFFRKTREFARSARSASRLASCCSRASCIWSSACCKDLSFSATRWSPARAIGDQPRVEDQDDADQRAEDEHVSPAQPPPCGLAWCCRGCMAFPFCGRLEQRRRRRRRQRRQQIHLRGVCGQPPRHPFPHTHYTHDTSTPPRGRRAG